MAAAGEAESAGAGPGLGAGPGVRPLIFSYANCAFYDMALNFLLAARAADIPNVYIIPTGAAQGRGVIIAQK